MATGLIYSTLDTFGQSVPACPFCRGPLYAMMEYIYWKCPTCELRYDPQELHDLVMVGDGSKFCCYLEIKMKVADLMEDLEKGDRTMEHLAKADNGDNVQPATIGGMNIEDFQRAFGQLGTLGTSTFGQSMWGQAQQLGNQQLQSAQSLYGSNVVFTTAGTTTWR